MTIFLPPTEIKWCVMLSEGSDKGISLSLTSRHSKHIV